MRFIKVLEWSGLVVVGGFLVRWAAHGIAFTPPVLVTAACAGVLVERLLFAPLIARMERRRANMA